MSALRQAAQKVVDERFRPGSEWDDLKNAICELASALERPKEASPTNDGGPAFPWEDMKDTSGEPRASAGMSLRDWFAGMALHGLLANPGGPIQANGMCGWNWTNCTPDQVCRQAFGVADAMLAARGRKEGQQP